MRINEIRDAYIAEGCSYLDATSSTSQDVLLALIANSSLTGHVTIKGGVVIQHMSGDSRRATQDIDLDFIKYPISDDSIVKFISNLNLNTEDIGIKITAPIEELLHQDYNGKRVYVSIVDKVGTKIETKLDIGVHKNLDLKQDDFYFDLGKLDDGVTLLINTKEQIFTEKLKSLLRIGAASTRYKDVFDMYYLAVQSGLDTLELGKCLQVIIYSDKTMREKEISAVASRMKEVLKDNRFIERLGKSKRSNWLNTSAEAVTRELLAYINRL